MTGSPKHNAGVHSVGPELVIVSYRKGGHPASKEGQDWNAQSRTLFSRGAATSAGTLAAAWGECHSGGAAEPGY
ncbi:MAG: hypothetical protein GTO63_35585 [Anaerolineae bacterium]|nr:hypothetical protein [Anaerolineae bacterium]NIO00074.1 hypothetical protein [Anaerolineae bacterium]NIQ82858.1 hypothetical protein [Anaerolineae bacterium]